MKCGYREGNYFSAMNKLYGKILCLRMVIKKFPSYFYPKMNTKLTSFFETHRIFN